MSPKTAPSTAIFIIFFSEKYAKQKSAQLLLRTEKRIAQLLRHNYLNASYKFAQYI